jgi:hypothetical protein
MRSVRERLPMNSEVSRMPEPQRALLGFLRFDPVTNEPRRQLSDAIQKRASGNCASDRFPSKGYKEAHYPHTCATHKAVSIFVLVEGWLIGRQPAWLTRGEASSRDRPPHVDPTFFEKTGKNQKNLLLRKCATGSRPVAAARPKGSDPLPPQDD